MAQGTATRGRVAKPAHRAGRKDTARTSSALKRAASTIPQPPEPGKYWIRIVLDYGTKNQSAAIRIVCKDSAPANNDDIEEAVFDNGLHNTPQIIGFEQQQDGTRKVFWGTGVTNALNAGQLQVEDTIEMWKLALYKDHASSATVKHIQQQMEKFDVDIVELTAVHLEHMIPAIREELRGDVKAMLHPDVENMPIELWISVPQMCEAPACQKMLKAAETIAKKVGVKWVKLIYEPECATAWHLHSMRNVLTAGYRVGDEIIVSDIGGATGDFDRVVYDSDPSDGARVVLRNTGKASGALCGSELVNEAFRTWLMKGPRKGLTTFRGKCKELGLSEMACLKRASDSFEDTKKKFRSTDAEPGFVVVRGAPGAKRPMWAIEVTSEDMVSFFEPALTKIIRCIKQQRTQNTKKVLVTGGFGRSKYVVARLKEEFESGNNHNISVDATYMGGRADRAVSMGGMLRWPEIVSVGFDKTSLFGIPMEEEYNEEYHPDADATLILESPFSVVRVVKSRWLPLVNKNTERGEGETFVVQKWQYSICPVNDQWLEIPVYWTKETIEEHEAIFKAAVEGSGLRDEIELWDTLYIELPDFKALGFSPIKLEHDDSRPNGVDQHEGDVYQYYWRITLEGKGANVSFKWELAEAGTQPYDEEGEPLDVEAQMALPVAWRLCTKDFDPFPKSNF